MSVQIIEKNGRAEFAVVPIDEYHLLFKKAERMAQANRHHIPGQVGHIAHRCHKKEFFCSSLCGIASGRSSGCSRRRSAMWNAETTSAEMRKQVLRSVIEEIICEVDEEKSLVLLNIHWAGGVHGRLDAKKNRSGEHRHSTNAATVDLVRKLSKQIPDKSIVPLLNRLKIKTGRGNTWTRDRVRSFRGDHRVPVYDGKEQSDKLTLEAAAERLGICAQSVKSLFMAK